MFNLNFIKNNSRIDSVSKRGPSYIGFVPKHEVSDIYAKAKHDIKVSLEIKK